MSVVKFFLTLGLLLFCSFANAQNKVPNKDIRFIALGELHPWVPNGPNEHGIIKPKPIPKGAQPPNALRYSTGGETKPLRLPLLQFSPYATLKGDDKLLSLKDIDGGKFLKSPAPKEKVNLGVLFANYKTMNWTDPEILMLKDDARSFPSGQIRFVNVSDRTVSVEIEGHSRFKLKSGATILKSLKDIGTFKGGKFIQPTDGNAYIELAFLDSKNKVQNLLDNTLSIRKGERIQCFFYKSKGKGAAKEVKHLIVPEKIPK